MTDDCSCSAKDWSGDWRTLALIWWLPGGLMLAATLIDPTVRAAIWTVMLLWMGGACIANAKRCGRVHCYLTGPFFILMAAGVVAHATGVLSLGRYGWSLLGGITVVGAFGLCWASERMLGRFV